MAKKIAKKMITVDLETVEFYSTLDTSIALLQGYSDKYSHDHKELYLEGGMYYIPYDDQQTYRLTLKGTRLENDDEYKKRLAEDQAQKTRWETKEREQYEVLKKKFESK